jgi:Fe-S-cluster containining protein
MRHREMEVEKVDCRPCTACCRGELVLLVDGDDNSRYDTLEIATPNLITGAEVSLALKQRPDGACIYLGEQGCTIYDARPIMCQVFSCVGWVRSILDRAPCADVRGEFASGKLDKEIWNAGISRMKPPRF